MTKYIIIAYKESEHTAIRDCCGDWKHSHNPSKFSLEDCHVGLNDDEAAIKIADVILECDEFEIHIIKIDGNEITLHKDIFFKNRYDGLPDVIQYIKERSLIELKLKREEEKRIEKEKQELEKKMAEQTKQEQEKLAAEKKIADDLALLKRLQEIYGKDAV